MNEVVYAVLGIGVIQTREVGPMKAAFTLTPAESKRGSKGVCETCRYACCFAGREIEALPEWLQD